MIDLHRTEVDGVDTIWANAPGPLQAALLFRTGKADEQLITSGHTHLIEHMALSMDVPNQLSNGYVDSLSTTFLARGSSIDIANCLSRICSNLNNLPKDRLDGEIRILAAEQESRSYDAIGNLMMWRFGTVNHGLRGLGELGLRKVSMGQLEEWRAGRFTKGNALLWMSGPLPADLRLDLPDGEKQPLPPIIGRQPNYPCWYPNDRFGGMAVGSLVRRTAIPTFFCLLATNHLIDQLRTNRGLSYSPMAFYDRLTAEAAHLVLFADSDQNHRGELVEAMSDVYENISEISEAEIEAAKCQLQDIMVGPSSPPPYDRTILELQHIAMDWVLDSDYLSTEDYLAEVKNITKADVTSFVSEFKKSSMFAIPSGVSHTAIMGQELELSSPAVNGRATYCMDHPFNKAQLVTNSEGATILFANGESHTMRYKDLTGVIKYDDGGFVLINSNATILEIEPTLWRNGRKVCKNVLDRIPSELIIPFGVRSNENIPKPKTSWWKRFFLSFTTTMAIFVIISFGIFIISLLTTIISGR